MPRPEDPALPRPGELRWAAVLVAGGRSRRFGSDKLAAPFAGRSLLATALDGVLALTPPPEHPVVVVGPRRQDLPADRVRVVREHPAGTGPAVAAVTGARGAPPADVVVVLPGDAPYAAEAVPALLAALAPGDGDRAPDAAVAVDARGRRQHLLVAVRGGALAAREVTAGTPARRLLDGWAVVEVPVPGRATLDVDDPAALDRAVLRRGPAAGG